MYVDRRRGALPGGERYVARKNVRLQEKEEEKSAFSGWKVCHEEEGVRRHVCRRRRNMNLQEEDGASLGGRRALQGREMHHH